MYNISGTVLNMIMIFVTLVENDDISRYFLHFFGILIFCLVIGVKGHKCAKMTKNSICDASNLRNYTSHIIMVHMCQMFISPGIFSKFQFSGLLVRVKGQKMTQSTEDSVCCTPISGAIHHMIDIYSTHV